MHFIITEYQPAESLLPFVHSYWTGYFNPSESTGDTQSVVPNGCIELIIHLSDTHCYLLKDGKIWSKSPKYTLLGLHTRPYEVTFADVVNVFGIRFYPDGIRHLFGVAPASFMATYENGVDVLGSALQDFCARMRETDHIEAQVAQADAYLRSQLVKYHLSYDYTHLAMQLVRASAGDMDYRRLSRRVPISDRQLQREFRNQYGITVSDYMRLARMNAVQRYMRSGKVNLTHLSYDLQFTDQSHFIREFKHHVGVPPGRFLKTRHRYIVNPAMRNEQARVQAKTPFRQ